MTNPFIAFCLEDLVEGTPSDQLRETVEQVNKRIKSGAMNIEIGRSLIQQALQTENTSRCFGLPLEMGSAQTLAVEAKRSELLNRAARK